MSKKPYLSIVIPAFNEEINFNRGCLNDLIPFLESKKYNYELIFSDDGSTDKTLELLNKFKKDNKSSLKYGGIKVLKNKHGGKLYAVYSGIKSASGTWCLFTDFDQSTSIREVDKLLRYKDNGYKIIFGSRKLNDSKVKTKWYRKFVGDVFNITTRTITGLKIKDTQCGFKLFNKDAFSLFDNLYVYNPKKAKEKNAFTGAFDVELFVIAKNKNYGFKEVPVEWRHYPTNRVNIIKDSFRMFIDIIKIKIAEIKGRYK